MGFANALHGKVHTYWVQHHDSNVGIWTIMAQLKTDSPFQINTQDNKHSQSKNRTVVNNQNKQDRASS